MEFYKVSGSGNDFLALIEPQADPSAEQIAAWCRRGISLGADGLFVLRRLEHGAAMAYWNSDGQPARLCINGTRCAARLAYDLGWAAGETTIETGALAAHDAYGQHVARMELMLQETQLLHENGRKGAIEVEALRFHVADAKRQLERTTNSRTWLP